MCRHILYNEGKLKINYKLFETAGKLDLEIVPPRANQTNTIVYYYL